MNKNYVGQFVGVVPPSAFATLGYPKQLLLMFDSLALDLGAVGLSLEDRKIIKDSMVEINWLLKSEMLTLLSGLQASNELRPSEQSIEHARNTLGVSQVTHERFNAYLLRKKGIDAVPIMSPFEDLDIDAEADRDAVIRLTIRSFPVPTDITPWEAIADFRSDKEARGKFWSLKQWINKVGKNGLKNYEVTDELKSLLNEYSKSMNLHKLKNETGVFEVLVTTTASVAEDLVRFKWSSIVKSVFQVHRQGVKLLEG